MATAELVFEVGDPAVHPVHGVAEVVAIEAKQIAGKPESFYILRVLHNGTKLMVPVNGAERAGLRNVISKEAADEVFQVLGASEVAVKPGPWNRRFREYSELVSSGHLTDVAKVYRDLWRIRPDRELSYSERRLLEQSKNLLVAELAIAQQRDVKDVESALQSAVES